MIQNSETYLAPGAMIREVARAYFPQTLTESKAPAKHKTLTDIEIQAIRNRRITPLVPRLKDIYNGSQEQRTQTLEAINQYRISLRKDDSNRHWLEAQVLRALSR